MNQSGQSKNPTATQQAIEIAIRLGLIFVLVAWCFQIITPFISVVVWGAIIAIALYKPFLKLAEKMGGNNKLAATTFTLAGLAIILVPVISLSGSLIESASMLADKFSAGTITIPVPADSVKEWPVVGEKVYEFWHEASVNLSAFIEKYSTQLSALGIKLAGLAAGVGAGVLQFVISMLIAGVFLSGADASGKAIQNLAIRLSGKEHGQQLISLSTATIRSVAVGVLGIAVIQAILAGVGMMFADVPAAGLLAFVVLVLAIAQLPPILVLLPVIFYVFSVASTTVAVVFMIWSILVSMSDAVLKPLLLGRGVDAPMLVILLGAIGGMIFSGIVGLFIGAVILALGYKLFQVWLQMAEPDQNVQAVEQDS